MNLTTEEFLELAEEAAPFEPCVGSGYCCKKVPCHVAFEVLGDVEAPCPALVWSDDDDRYYCGVVLDSERYGVDSEFVRRSLGIGAGCCSSMNDDHRKAISPYLSDPRVQDLIGLDKRRAYMRGLSTWADEVREETSCSTDQTV